jgi:hypothetical protein
MSGADGHLLAHYFTVTNPSGFTLDQQVAVSGYRGQQAWYDAANQSGRIDPVPGRVDIPGYSSAVWNAIVPVALRYDPVTNPSGARPTMFDWVRNIYGRDPVTGFGLRPYDNVGVQYGLGALNSGAITTTQFLDLNQGIGGVDNDFNYTANRAVGDAAAIRRTYQAGLNMSGSGGLATSRCSTWAATTTRPAITISGTALRSASGSASQWRRRQPRHVARLERALCESLVSAQYVGLGGQGRPLQHFRAPEGRRQQAVLSWSTVAGPAPRVSLPSRRP